jgi:monothiol glutaredoxin
MKGTRKMPQCGFSKFVVVLLNAYNVKNFKDVNVLADEKLREQIKLYSNWPTLPQVYIKGQFVGGCDIMKEMHEDGSLRELLIQHNIVKDSDAIGEVKR